MTVHPHFPWISWSATGDDCQLVRDSRNGDEMVACTSDEFLAFIADHSARRSFGLGDVIHKAAKVAGFQRCAPCAARQAELNRITNKF